MFCSNCGQRLEDGMLFCPNCGTKIQWNYEEETVRESHAGEDEAEEVKQEETETEENNVTEINREKSVSEISKSEEVQAEGKTQEEENQEGAQEVEPKEEEQRKKDQKDQEENASPLEALPQGELTKKKKGGVGFLTFLLCLVIFLGVLATGISGALRFTYTEEQVCSMMNRFDVTQVTIQTSLKGEELSFVDFLEKVSDFDFEKSAGVNKKDLEKLLCKPYVSELATKYVVGYVNYFFTGRKPESFTRNDVVDFVREHDDDFFELMKFRFTYMDPTVNRRKVYTVDIDNAFKDLGTDEITVDWIQETSGIKLSWICMLLSVPVLAGVGAFCFLLFVIVILIQSKKHKGVLADGLTVFFAGLVIDVTVEVGFYLWGAKKSGIVYFALSPLFHNLLILGSVILVTGLIMILLASKAGNKKEKVAQAEGQGTEQAEA